ncbi:hypothetical protein [Streptomyces candidus]|uniref:DNA-directed RNA polymerase specialized sigma24 family protein n=1 Tax=Streptomyces candidus TaxID=67283 RepID=A0A7X0HA16_9ACTN|nr:hypothetical protein [Streptomyces candidus]MBB6433833.1 hypothetical protein [Streptomyces candidus]GHH34387.1 hypothetical protein GCM10018773_06430 [Streptomyces candidus]
MDTQDRTERTAAHEGPLSVAQAEAALVEHYPRLVRLAFITLPPALGRHRRVLVAHGIAQRALPARTRPARRTAPGVPGQRTAPAGTGGGSAYAALRARVLRESLAYGKRPGWWPGRVPAPDRLRHVLPAVWGLRVFPAAGGADELALEQALSGADAATRAALALRRAEDLTEDRTRDLLAEAGVAEPALALRTAERLAKKALGESAEGAGHPLLSGEFDPCFVHTRPTDLLRRRHRLRTAGAALVVAAVAAATLPLELREGPGTQEREAATGARNASIAQRVTDPRNLVRAKDDEWADTSRVDFTVWPARGDRRDDLALLDRALKVWSAPARTVRISSTPGTGTAPPAEPPRLLYAGDVDGAAVVLLNDGDRTVRYTEPADASQPPVLDFARTDDADVVTGAALVVTREGPASRFLLAPWIDETRTRDLLKPGAPGGELAVRGDGVTAAVPRPGAGGTCDSWPVLQLRSSELIVEKHAFLLTDLGDLAPVHLTYTPPPGSGAPARQPREATGAAALANWARTACHLPSLRGAGVRAVNNWVYAQQTLPEGAGRADWVCTRADTWRGPGRVLVQLQLPGTSPTALGVPVVEARDTAACSRFGQHVLAGAGWKGPKSGDWYLLAAGSRKVQRIQATGGVRADANGATMAVRAPRGVKAELRARMADGSTLEGLR